MLAGRDADTLSQVSRGCAAAGAATARFVPTDVTDPSQVQQLAKVALQSHQKIDVWINGVGVGAVGHFDKTPIEAHRRVIEANLLGHVHGAHAALRHFRERGQGILINMISIGGWVPAPFAAAYTASKFGLRGFSEALRAEVSDQPNIHVCDVAPTVVDSPGLSHGANYTGHDIRLNMPLVDPLRVAKAVVHIAASPRPVTWIGATALPARLAHTFAPRLLTAAMHRVADWALRRSPPIEMSDGNLYKASVVTTVHGRGSGKDAQVCAPSHAGRTANTVLAAALGAFGAVSLFLLMSERRRAKGKRAWENG